MREIDRWVIKKAFRLLANGLGNPGKMYGINLSSQSLSDEEFLEFVLAQLRETGIVPQSICFEITETAFIAKFDQTKRIVTALKATGIRFALDDFGAGLSSFRYLKALPVDYLKIDGSFIKDMMNDPLDDAIVKAIVDVSCKLNAQTIAKSVETTSLAEHLKELHVDHAQGYAIAMPRPLELFS